MSENPAANAIHWFEIPTTDLERATTFYEALLACTKMHRATYGYPMAIFPYAQPGIGGALIQDPSHKPSADGPLLYLACEKLDEAEKRVEPNGGELLRPYSAIPGGFGFEVILKDTEGNRVALHSR